MGYDSTFSGSLSPNKPIPDELIARINDKCDLCVCTADSCDDHDGELGDVVPCARTMHGYDLTNDVFKVQRMLKPHGILLTGEIYRKGEDDDDFEKIEVVDGKVYASYGEVVYKNRKRLTVRDVTRYAVKVMSGSRFAGWLGRPDMLTGRYPTVKPGEPGLVNGKVSYDVPPFQAMLGKKGDAEEAVRTLSRSRRSKRKYEIVAIEDKL